jgi:hypothetical protein
MYKPSVDRLAVKSIGIVRITTMTNNYAPQQTSPPSMFNLTCTSFDPAAWEDAPPFLLQVPNKSEQIAI